MAQILTALVKGFTDSFLGIGTLYRTSGRSPATKEKPEPKPAQENKSVLQLRREQKCSNPSTKEKPPDILWRLAQCCFLNGFVFGVGIFCFAQLFLPAVCWFIEKFITGPSNGTCPVITQFLSSAFSVLWCLPLLFLCKIINVFWFQDIADWSLKSSSQSTKPANQSSSPGHFIADYLFTMIVETVFVLQDILLGYVVRSIGIDVIATIATMSNIVHYSLLCSIYAFEYKWFYEGLAFEKRLSNIETNWAYFLGFGLPLTMFSRFLCSRLPSYEIYLNAVSFALFFPFMIISANEVKLATFAIGRVPILRPCAFVVDRFFRMYPWTKQRGK